MYPLGKFGGGGGHHSKRILLIDAILPSENSYILIFTYCTKYNDVVAKSYC